MKMLPISLLLLLAPLPDHALLVDDFEAGDLSAARPGTDDQTLRIGVLVSHTPNAAFVGAAGIVDDDMQPSVLDVTGSSPAA